MNNLIFSLNATIPIFLVMVFGWFLMQMKLFNANFCTIADRYVFKVALPVLLFRDIATMDLHKDFDWSFVIFCAAVTTIMFMGVWALTNLFMKDKSMVGAFSQAAVRGSGAILGIAFVENIYGNSGLAPLMIVAAIPLYNIYSVIILTFGARSRTADSTGRELAKKTLKNIITNPIILGILAGLPFSFFQISIPEIPLKALTSVANTATPIALLMIGAEFEGKKALTRIKPTLLATAIKLVILPALILPAAVAMGFRDSALISILIVAGSPTTVSCYIMAKNMDNDEILTSSIVVLATLLSSVTLTVWIFILKNGGLI
ncbi:AEC family transporter [Hespellia stercorisuis]|uniref:AEC family transporter n=1 Tax=Hespellia stercorisuis DSM 15480 TaxID=1121950 RepID=A0A1M6U0M4_9FIRM|nr:AEC family transporter [Hespellia stercorisuis]SHK62852.1 hypothetical protein SAMN02745243_03375 [Hespellia stercorisuis DSM 15480]